jgi:hypothetical protein
MPADSDERTRVEQEHGDPYESTARWMVEAGRRRSARASAQQESPRESARRLPRPRTFFGIAREVYLFAVLVAVYLNYYFMQVMEEIQSLESIIVFIPASPAG